MEKVGDYLNKKKWQPKPLNTLEGLPIRPSIKKTRLYLDNEYYEGGYAALFPHSVTSVYGWLARRAKQKTQTCYPSAADIMKHCGITNRNTAFIALKILEAYNIIYIIHRSKGRVPNVYALLDPSHWKSINSANFDTVMQRIKKKRTVSDKPTQQYQNQLLNSGIDDTRSHITKSDNEINSKNKEKETPIKGEELLQRLPIASRSVITPYFLKSDIVGALEEISENGTEVEKISYSTVLAALLRRGAIPTKDLPIWIKV